MGLLYRPYRETYASRVSERPVAGFMFLYKKQQGFIQIPILIAIIAGILIVGGGGYLGVEQYKNYQAEKREKEAAVIAEAQQKEKDAQAITEAQQKALAQAQEEIEKLKEQSIESKSNQKVLEQKIQNQQQSSSKNISISAEELDPYLGGIVRISCAGGSGSGSLWNIEGQGFMVLTNQHVVESESGTCGLDITKTNNNSYGFYDALLDQRYRWNDDTDSVALGMQINKKLNDSVVGWTSSANESAPVSELNYKVSALRKCPVTMPLGSPVALIGYPAFAKQVDYYQGNEVISHFKTVTNGIISAHDKSPGLLLSGLPASNYFVSNKIDSGNSGGIALSKDQNGLCVLGIPTWLTVGNYETQGIVQNIHNITHQKLVRIYPN